MLKFISSLRPRTRIALTGAALVGLVLGVCAVRDTGSTKAELPAPGSIGPICGDGAINGSEECDGALLPRDAKSGDLCSPSCTLAPAKVAAAIAPVAATCGDGIRQSTEECDGRALPVTAKEGSSCSPRCKLLPPPPEQTDCRTCMQRSCAPQRATVEAELSSMDPILDCVLGTAWAQYQSVAETTCASADLLTCYCGTQPALDCANTAPAALKGKCVPEILAATNCTTSICVASAFMDPANANGKAMLYAQCEQDYCHSECLDGE